MQPGSMVSIAAGPSQLIAALCDEMGLENMINQTVEWDPSQWKASPGTHIKAMIINILCSRMPLYRVSEFYQDLDVEMLLGSAHEANDFNDDALGRTLDRLYDAQSWNVYSTLSLSVLRKLGLSLDTLHNDTTSFSVSGEYADQEHLKVTHGYNKDGRPDLKQIVIGIGVTPERLPIVGKIEDGNLDDKTWNHAFISRLRSILSDVEWNNLTYVADSALATMDNVLLMMQEKLSFITRLPDTFALSTELKEEAAWREAWETVGALSEEPKSAAYRVQSFVRELYGHSLRFVVVHSDHLETRQFETLRRQMEQERKALEKSLQTLQSQRFACEHDAEQAIAAFCKQHKSKWHTFHLSPESETFVMPRKRRGRPKAGEVAETGTHWKVAVSELQADEAALTAQAHKLGMLILMTSHMEDARWTSLKVLQTYKGQSAAETRFRLLKDPAMLDAIYLKLPHRIETLGTVFLMALLLYGVLEWRVRENLKHEQEPVILPGKRKSYKPTAEMLLALLKTIQVILFRMDGQIIRHVSDHVNDNVKRILRLAGYDINIYTARAVEETNR